MSSGKRFPKMVTCVYCCQKTSIHSIRFHIKACEGRREREQLTMPEELRIPIDLSGIPEYPQEDDDYSAYKEFNEAVEEAHQASMPRCPNCTRSFFTGQLVPGEMLESECSVFVP